MWCCCFQGIQQVLCATLVWLFSIVCFQMSPQITCPRRGIVTLVAFVWLFSTVCFQMTPQIPWLNRCIVTLIAFVWFFSTVRFQMTPQIACPRRCVFTLIALEALVFLIWSLFNYLFIHSEPIWQMDWPEWVSSLALILGKRIDPSVRTNFQNWVKITNSICFWAW